MLKVKEVAKQLGVSQHTVGIWINAGELPAINVARKPGGKPIWRIDPEALEAFIVGRQPVPPVPRTQRRRRTEQPAPEFY